jgi:hypothetical protein
MMVDIGRRMRTKLFSRARILWPMPNVLGIEMADLAFAKKGGSDETDPDQVQDEARNGG